MKSLNILKSVRDNAMMRLALLSMALMAAPAAHALTKTDLTQDISGGKTFDDIATNIDNTAQIGASLLIQIVTIGGFVIIALSVYQFYKASKDEREKPTSAIVGLVIGGLMASIGSVMWIMKNSVVG